MCVLDRDALPGQYSEQVARTKAPVPPGFESSVLVSDSCQMPSALSWNFDTPVRLNINSNTPPHLAENLSYQLGHVERPSVAEAAAPLKISTPTWTATSEVEVEKRRCPSDESTDASSTTSDSVYSYGEHFSVDDDRGKLPLSLSIWPPDCYPYPTFVSAPIWQSWPHENAAMWPCYPGAVLYGGRSNSGYLGAVPYGRTKSPKWDRRRRVVRPRRCPLLIAEHLRELDSINPECIIYAKRINRLGFNSVAILKSHYEQYGPVEQVLVSNAHQRPCEFEGTCRIRPSGMAFVVMKHPEDTKKALEQGDIQLIGGVEINIRAFWRGSMHQGEEDETFEDS